MKSFISLEEAIEILNENIEKLEEEEINIVDALNRIVSKNIYSKINNPPFNKSAMDGYALNYEDGFLNNELKVIDKVFAGNYSEEVLTKNTCIRIMTGAPIPSGANCVVKQEDVELINNNIILKKTLKEYENVCLEGEDIKKDSLIVNSGKKLDYADIGLLASTGIEKIKVYRKPKIAFLSTGDEVVDITSNLGYGKIYNSNKYSIISRLKELNYEIDNINHINDDFNEIGNFINNISKEIDIIITTGGVSVGEKDLLKEAVKSINGERIFWKVNIKPGSAMLFSKVNNKPVISLSGNPTAALTTFELLVKPVLERLKGKDIIEIKREKAILKGEFKKVANKKRYLRGHYYIEDFKQYVYITQTKSGNGILSSAINSNCIIEINENNEIKQDGDIVSIIKL